MENEKLLLKVRNISKSFSGVKALDNVRLDIGYAEVHAVMGENGAGKSTLMNILLGLLAPDTGGEMFFKGQPYLAKSPHEALMSGISMIHQEIKLAPSMTIAGNIWIGREPLIKGTRLVDVKKMNRDTLNLFNEFGVSFDPKTRVSELTVAQRQLVEIIRAISYNANLIIMDEPTSALSDSEINSLFGYIRNLKKKGTSIILITHKLNEMMQICDKVTCLRDGQYIDTRDVEGLTERDMITMMIGRDLKDVYPDKSSKIGDVVFEVEGLKINSVFEDISFNVRSGEVLGFAGLMGAGRSEIMRAIFGIDKLDEGIIKIDGKAVKIKSPSEALEQGIGFVSEDRRREGLAASLSVGNNITISNLKKYTKIFVDKKKEITDIKERIEALRIKANSAKQVVSSLSGGNQQKVVISKMLLCKPKILIMDEPTRGIDVGAKAEVYNLVRQLANEGMAVILVSSELTEILGMSDRVIVIHEGKITGEMACKDATQDNILRCAMGLEKIS